MRRLLMFFLVVLFLSLVPAAWAAPAAGPGNGTAPRARAAGSGSILADAIHWVFKVWEDVTAPLPAPGTHNGSCVDPDGGSCRSHG